jgi:hypothetical protein
MPRRQSRRRAPDQPAGAHRAEIVERNAEFGRHDVQAVQSEAGTLVGDIANTTCVDVAIEEHQYVAIDRRAAAGAALDVASGLEYLLERRHARLPPEENEGAKRGFAMLGPDGVAISGADYAIAFALRGNETRSLS